LKKNADCLAVIPGILLQQRRQGQYCPRRLAVDLPEGVTAHSRTNDKDEFLFIQNYTSTSQQISLDQQTYYDMLAEAYNTGISSKLEVPAYGIRVLKRSI